MFKKTLQHLGQVLVTVIGVTFLTFSLSFLAPGDPVLMILETADTMVSQELIDHTRQELRSWCNMVIGCLMRCKGILECRIQPRNLL